jgi:hypothetical protein
MTILKTGTTYYTLVFAALITCLFDYLLAAFQNFLAYKKT